MSTTSLPSYVAPILARTPTYTAEPRAYEQRLALNHLRQRPSGDFVKQSRTGSVSLRLIEQEDNVNLPVYGCGDSVEGMVDLSKPESVTNVDVKIEGSLRLKEIAEGGTTTQKLCLSTITLFSKNADSSPCPPSLAFSLTLPTTYSDGKDSYPLPPTYEAHLSGVPGFRANVEYSVSIVVQKNKAATLLRIGNNTVTTPFQYYPRSRPAVPHPSPLRQLSGYTTPTANSDWRYYESVITSKNPNGMDIKSKLYLPASRVFCMTQPMPFHLVFKSSAVSLASFLPFGPSASDPARNQQRTRIQLLRQTTVDVRNAVILGTKTDIWRVNIIGEGTFKHAGDGPDWIAFSGEIDISDEISIGGFKAGGLSIKDCVVLSMVPAEPAKAPFGELRQVIPVRLTTDPWTNDGEGQVFGASTYCVAPSLEGLLPELPRDA